MVSGMPGKHVSERTSAFKSPALRHKGITMTSEEVMLLKTLIRERVDVFGKCHILSEGDGCQCALCQIDRMDNDELRDSVESLIKNGYNKDRPFLSGQIRKGYKVRGLFLGAG